MRGFFCLLILFSLALPATGFTAEAGGAGRVAGQSVEAPKKHVKKKSAIEARGETGRKIEEQRRNNSGVSSSQRWKMKLPFWWRKILIFAELAFFIMLGVILGQMLEAAGVVKYVAIITTPLLWLGRLPRAAGTPFIMSLQSGAVANSMLVNCRDEGELSNRQLYTSVLVVSCLSLFAHLPTYIIPLGLAFGKEAAGLFFGVRFGAIMLEMVVILLVSRTIIKRYTGDSMVVIPEEERLFSEFKSRKKSEHGYFKTVWLRSRRTIKRLLLFLLPSFFVMVGLEYFGVFNWLTKALPEIFSYSFLPPEAAAIIPAQAINLYNGAIAAGNFVDEGILTPVQAVLILLCGSLVTSPVRTLKHALPTYIAVLGPKAGTVMAILAQLLRVIFVGGATAALIIFLA